MIRVDDLRKAYDGFVAVDGSTFEVESGEVFGVVGPNGAGKTTTLKMLAGLVEPTSGDVEVAGASAGSLDMRRNLGFLPEESPLYEEMTAMDYLMFFADLYDVPTDVARGRIDESLTRLDLEHRERRIGDMSKGMKRKVAIARSLVNDPEVLIYDEPASGLDPLTTNYIIEFTRELADEGKTIVFSAHNLYHVESICDRLIVMNQGDIIARGTLDEIQEAHGQSAYHVYTDVPVRDAAHDDDENHYEVVVSDMDAVERVRREANADGGRVVDIQTEDPSLEDIFLDIAGERVESAREPEGERPTEEVET
jgi:ABC-2 type transport system ATP-binding protein